MITLAQAFELGRYSYIAATEQSRIQGARRVLHLPDEAFVEVLFEVWEKNTGFEATVGVTSPYFGSRGYLDLFTSKVDADAFIEECKTFLMEVSP